MRDPATTSRIMSSIRSRDTGPELLLRRELHRRGLRYRLRYPLTGRPDLVFTRARVAVFVDGDYWHGNTWRLRGATSLDDYLCSLSNSAFWRQKITANMARDRAVTHELRNNGWRVVRVWESDLERDLEQSAAMVERVVRGGGPGLGVLEPSLETPPIEHPVSGPSLTDFGLPSHSDERAKPDMAVPAPLQSVELFAGGGGMALGMRAAGFHHHALVEWWAPAARVLRHNAELRPELWKPDQIIENDVRTVIGDLGEPGTVHLVAGGPPCQPFSFAGAHAGDNDERNMFPAAIATVRQLRPQLVVFENVPGLTRPSFAPYLDYVKAQLRHPDIAPRDSDELWSDHDARIRASTAAPEYSVYPDFIDAADLGVPQSRRRVFLIAIRRDVTGADTWANVRRTHSRDALLYQQYITGTYWERHNMARPPVPPRLLNQVRRVDRLDGCDDHKPWTTLRDALSDIPDPSDKELPGWPNHLAIPGARTYAKHTGSPLDLPSKTIKAGVHGVSGGEGMLRELDGSVRYLSIREAALVQGFPVDYEFPGVRSRVMGVIGNAVALDVAASLGHALRQHTRL
ncbi:MAG: hypothetical protein JWP75_346 [Frondihabitans sp.]|nr:hypothetical protein [Frondihabitans sp.]